LCIKSVPKLHMFLSNKTVENILCRLNAGNMRQKYSNKHLYQIGTDLPILYRYQNSCIVSVPFLYGQTECSLNEDFSVEFWYLQSCSFTAMLLSYRLFTHFVDVNNVLAYMYQKGIDPLHKNKYMYLVTLSSCCPHGCPHEISHFAVRDRTSG
jgi:hypothetical protein